MIQLQEFTGLCTTFRRSDSAGGNEICPVYTRGPPFWKPGIACLTPGEGRMDLTGRGLCYPVCAHLFQASILDLHSGALSVGKHFVNLYR